MRRPSVALLAALLLAARCSAHSPQPAPPAARAAVPPDWFQQQLGAARQARSSHLPHDDAAGGQAAYDTVVRRACVRVALSGPEKYQARCAALLQRPSSESAAPFACDDAATDPSALHACND